MSEVDKPTGRKRGPPPMGLGKLKVRASLMIWTLHLNAKLIIRVGPSLSSFARLLANTLPIYPPHSLDKTNEAARVSLTDGPGSNVSSNRNQTTTGK
jgi:hypothetical protein